MNILVLMPRFRRLEYAFFGDGDRKALLELRQSDFPSEGEGIVDALDKIRADCMMFNAGPPDIVVIRSAYGGSMFSRTTPVDVEMLSRLATLAPDAPMHVPQVCQSAKAALKAFAESMVVMAFETAFFVDLPDRERRYAIADDRMRKFGYHGLYHQAACNEPDGLRSNGATRTLSLCLEPQPEVVAILGHRPVLTTSGVTPLEGLPGETTCGDLDPTIVLTLARRLNWGPEEINNVLTRQSGLRGLLGRSLCLGQVLASEAWPKNGHLCPGDNGTPHEACNILAYRILLAGGASVAAMGGLDRIVLSGRYADQGQGLGQWLSQRLRARNASANRPMLLRSGDTLARILADSASVLQWERMQRRRLPTCSIKHG